MKYNKYSVKLNGKTYIITKTPQNLNMRNSKGLKSSNQKLHTLYT